MSNARRDKILNSYDLPSGQHLDFELDHLIPLCLGGSDDDSNIGLSLAALWNRHGMPKSRIDWKCSCAAPPATVKSTWQRPRRLSPLTGLTLT